MPTEKNNSYFIYLANKLFSHIFVDGMWSLGLEISLTNSISCLKQVFIRFSNSLNQVFPVKAPTQISSMTVQPQISALLVMLAMIQLMRKPNLKNYWFMRRSPLWRKKLSNECHESKIHQTMALLSYGLPQMSSVCIRAEMWAGWLC